MYLLMGETSVLIAVNHHRATKMRHPRLYTLLYIEKYAINSDCLDQSWGKGGSGLTSPAAPAGSAQPFADPPGPSSVFPGHCETSFSGCKQTSIRSAP